MIETDTRIEPSTNQISQPTYTPSGYLVLALMHVVLCFFQKHYNFNAYSKLNASRQVKGTILVSLIQSYKDNLALYSFTFITSYL